MTLIAVYPSKKELKDSVGNRLKYIETSMFGSQYRADGIIVVANRPSITKIGREFFAVLTMQNGLIKKVV